MIHCTEKRVDVKQLMAYIESSLIPDSDCLLLRRLIRNKVIDLISVLTPVDDVVIVVDIVQLVCHCP